MAIEFNETGDKVEKQINRGDRTSENTSKDSVIGGDRQDHQQIHLEAAKAGQTFERIVATPPQNEALAPSITVK